MAVLIAADREEERKREYMADVAWLTMQCAATGKAEYPMYRDLFGEKKAEKNPEKTLADIVKRRRKKRKKNEAI